MPLLSSQGFDHLLNLVGPRIKKNDTIFSKAIPPVECLPITLRYLASGESQQMLAFFFMNYQIICGTIFRKPL